MHSGMHLYPIDGKAGRIKNSGTPWSYRDAKWAQVMVGVDPDPANKEKISTWAKDYWNALHPHSAGGAYVNFMMDEGMSAFEQRMVRTTPASQRSKSGTIQKTCFASIKTLGRFN